MSKKFPSKHVAFALLILVALLVAACATAPADSAGGEGEAAAPAAAGERSVSVLGAMSGTDMERFLESLVPFEEETGIDVVYETSTDFNQTLLVRSEGNNLPDIAMFPQPGFMAELARDGVMVPLEDVLDMNAYRENYEQGWVDLASVDGEVYGVWYRASIKSLVWYPVPEFEEAGYTIPESYDELLALTDQMVEDGYTPWCLGMESGNGTGWVGTDWVEDIMLRTAGAEGYDQWTSGELDFDSPEVKRAFELFGEVVQNEDYTLGGTAGVLTINFGDSPLPLFEDPPGCMMHRQANFIANFFPEEVQGEIGEHVNAFYFPPIDEEDGRPVLGAGDVFGMFNASEEAQEFMRYVATAESTEYWAKQGGFLSPHKGVPLDWYPDEITRTQADIIVNAEVFRFDGSDLMPGAVGTGSFWTEMVNWVGGQDLDTTMQQIDASWPE